MWQAGAVTPEHGLGCLPISRAAVDTHAGLDVERIEVLKGPQGTLFGQNSTGGAVNYIAAKPTKDFAAGFDASIGRFGQGEANAYVSGPLTETLKVRIAGQYGYGSPWQRSYTRDDKVGRRNYLNGRILADWQAAPNLRFQLNLNGWKDKSAPSAAQLVAVYPQLELPGGVSAVDPRVAAFPLAPRDPRAADWRPAQRPEGDRGQYQAALRADLDISDNIVLTSLSSYVHLDSNVRLDMDATPFQVFEYFIDGTIKSFTQELRLAGGEGTPFRWVIGGNYENSHTAEHQATFYPDGTISKFLPSVSGALDAFSRKRNVAGFGNAEFEVTPGLTLKAGGRYTRSYQYMNECTHDSGDGTNNATFLFFYGLFHPGQPLPAITTESCTLFDNNFNFGAFEGKLKENNFSWRLGVDYKASRDLLLYANVAKGYKAGGFPVTTALFANTNNPIGQESLLDYEAGFKARFLDRRLSLNGAVFLYDYRNKQLLGRIRDLAINQLIAALENIPKSQVKGLELELTGTPIDGLQFSAGLTYLDGKIKKYSGLNASGVTADFAGERIPYTSKWQYLLSVDYTLPTGGNLKPFVGATLTGRSSATAIIGTFEGAPQLAGFRSSLPIDEIYKLPKYTLVDARVGVETGDGDWRFTAFGRNIGNKFYVSNVVTSFESISRYTGQPATYGVIISHKFR
jgi:outer membrane receptor protein involved in Fe transport